MKKALYIILQCTWGIPQTLIGAIIFLLLIRNRHFMYHGSIATYWDLKTSASLGMFIFITKHCNEETATKLTVHEYGHTIQSLISGPLYLIIFALPSFIWCMLPVFNKYRIDKGIPYYDFFIEHNANILGEYFTHEKAF